MREKREKVDKPGKVYGEGKNSRLPVGRMFTLGLRLGLVQTGVAHFVAYDSNRVALRSHTIGIVCHEMRNKPHAANGWGKPGKLARSRRFPIVAAGAHVAKLPSPFNFSPRFLRMIIQVNGASSRMK